MEDFRAKAIAWNFILLSALCFGKVYAESGVRVFGIVDAGVEVSSAGKGTQTRVVSGGDAGSRWGIDGTEDLGQGLSATFRLVGGFSADDGQMGQGGRLFGREAAVGLIKRDAGSLLLGRQPTPVSLTNSFVDAFYWMGSGGLISLTRSGATAAQQVIPQVVSARADNAIKYYSPEEWKSVSFSVLVAPGEKSPQLGSTYGASARFLQGPWDLNAAWGRQEAGTGATGQITSYSLGGSYDFHLVKLYLGYTDEKNSCSTCTGALTRATDSFKATRSEFSLANVGVRVPIGRFTAIAQAAYVNDRSAYQVDPGNRNAWWFAVGGEYALSRRTTLYGSVGTIENRNGSMYALGSGGVQQPANSVGAGNPRSTAGNIGIKHLF
ncbi:porin [Cupriavidus sp. WKF15]|uniref:porin n=1 Tax=Cupriavidus sp. WKF15 TaxID=3032282 RepID=UPI0023E3459E|nr:porin [Cupriavidus sp. WKF15]WER47962.1 porin [Cupriavidus sp. WKF15]